MKKILRFGLLLILCAAVLAGLAYWFVVSGGLIARQRPSSLETFVATKLVTLGIPRQASALKNPLEGIDANISAGRDLYQKNCETCHGFDGNGQTAAGLGVFPPPSSLGSSALAKRNRTDGELFYLIRNGVRNTAMPGWQFTD
ncbi:MAG TPA: cytochrome c, partial [Verrucomicrobiae bacterium]|nr:cytochrome c [Verrucomicrobiae bacterium]